MGAWCHQGKCLKRYGMSIGFVPAKSIGQETMNKVHNIMHIIKVGVIDTYVLILFVQWILTTATGGEQKNKRPVEIEIPSSLVGRIYDQV